MAGNVAISRLQGVALVGRHYILIYYQSRKEGQARKKKHSDLLGLGKPQSLPSTTDTPPVTGPHP